MVQIFRHLTQKNLFIFYYTKELSIKNAELVVDFQDIFFISEENKLIVIIEKDCRLTEKEALFVFADQNKKIESTICFIHTTGLVADLNALHSIYTSFANTSFERRTFESVQEIEQYHHINIFKDFAEISFSNE